MQILPKYNKLLDQKVQPFSTVKVVNRDYTRKCYRKWYVLV
jgi:hypothetical protein